MADPGYRAPSTHRRAVRPLPGVTTTYIVGKGDSLSVLAKRFNLKVAEIMALNNITNPNMIRRGQSLILPGKVDVSAPLRARKPARSKPKKHGNAYVVKRGDSLSKIAVEFGTTVSALKEANELKNTRIYAGQELVIPGRTSVKPPEAPKMIEEPAFDIDEPDQVEEPESSETGAFVEPLQDEVGAGSSEDDSLPEHTVAQGEDVYAVAARWRVSADELKELNGLTSDTLRPGTTLRIPVAADF
jgi:LysM repeat protein